MHPDAEVQSTRRIRPCGVGDAPLDGCSCRYGIGGFREGGEHSIAGVLDDAASGIRNGCVRDPVVHRECVRHGCAMPFPRLRTAFEIREEEAQNPVGHVSLPSFGRDGTTRTPQSLYSSRDAPGRRPAKLGISVPESSSAAARTFALDPIGGDLRLAQTSCPPTILPPSLNVDVLTGTSVESVMAVNADHQIDRVIMGADIALV